MKATARCLLFLFLAGCATKAVQVQQAIENKTLDSAIETIKTQQTAEVDKTLALLNLGMFYHLKGDYRASIASWQEAKKDIAKKRPTSITETGSSLLVNDSTQAYIGSYTEQQWLHILLALDYINLGEPQVARVEMLQADQLHKEYADQSNEPAFMRYLAGMVFDFLEEADQALVAYTKAYQLYGSQPPPSLLIDIARMYKQLALDSNLKQFIHKHSLPVEKVGQTPNVTLVLLRGLVSEKREKRIFHRTIDLEYSFSLAMPYYPQRNQQLENTLRQAGLHFTLVADIDSAIRNEFAEEEGKLLAKTIARQILKRQVSESLLEAAKEKDNPFARLLTTVYNIASERADLRSWNSLPATVMLYRTYIVPGERFSVQSYDSVVTVEIDNETSPVFRSFYQH